MNRALPRETTPAPMVAYQGFLLDVTEQKQAEIEIRRRNRELLALERHRRIAGSGRRRWRKA